MLESLGFGFLIVIVGHLLAGLFKPLFRALSGGASNLADKPKRPLTERERAEALHCKPGEHVYMEFETRKYSDYNGATNIRLDENGNYSVRVYNLKTGESHRLSARFTHELQHQMEQTFKAMAEREEERDAEISHMSFSKKNDVE